MRLDLTDTETESAGKGLQNLARVDEIYIASEMTPQGIDFLKQKGVKTFVDLKAPEETGGRDKELLGEDVEYHNPVFPGIDQTDHEYFQNINHILENASGSVCVYCKSGNRVVSLLAMLLVCVQGHNKKRILEWASKFPFYRKEGLSQLERKFNLKQCG